MALTTTVTESRVSTPSSTAVGVPTGVTGQLPLPSSTAVGVLTEVTGQMPTGGPSDVSTLDDSASNWFCLRLKHVGYEQW